MKEPVLVTGFFIGILQSWRGGRVVEGAALEKQYFEQSESRVRISPPPPVTVREYYLVLLVLVPSALQ